MVAATAFYIALFTYWTIRNHDGFGTYAFDFGIYDQGLWLLSRFERPFITIMGRHLFGDHTSFILLFLVPFYWVVPSAKVLLVAQAAALGIGAVPAFLVAREKLRHETLAAAIAVAYLLHPHVGWTNLEQFHPDVFEVPLLLFAFWFMLRARWAWYALSIGLLLLVKEDVGPLVFLLGIYVAVRHDRRVGLLTSAAGALAFATAMWWVLPALNGVGTLNTWRIPFGGPGGAVRTAVTDPGTFFSYVFEEKRRWYLWQMFIPLAGLSLLAPSVLLIAATPLAANLITTFYYQYDIHYHYGTLIVPVLVTAAVFAIARARSMNVRSALVAVVLVAALASAYMWGPTPFSRYRVPIADPDYPTVPYIHEAKDLIPDDAAVSAVYNFVPHIDHRERVYMFPTPFKATFWGTFDNEGERLPEADSVDYVFLPTQLDQEPKAVLDSIRHEFETVYEDGGVTLLRRR
ncbi:MAG TPA: DUF2079 domain-containing protein [Acidimicrobiales bacterium]|nr:DUF2079 domain-containing protein [Acidimicrobiales bacterium]